MVFFSFFFSFSFGGGGGRGVFWVGGEEGGSVVVWERGGG